MKKTYHVLTKRAVSYDSVKGEKIEEINQKLDEGPVFENFLKTLIAVGYKSIKVIGIYDPAAEGKDKVLTDSEDIEKAQALINEIVTPKPELKAVDSGQVASLLEEMNKLKAELNSLKSKEAEPKPTKRTRRASTEE